MYGFQVSQGKLAYETGLSLSPSRGKVLESDKIVVATGVPYYIIATKQEKILDPMDLIRNLDGAKGGSSPTGSRSHNIPVEIIGAKFENPSLFKVVGVDKNRILIQGVTTGDTSLTVTASTGKDKEKESITVHTAIPNRAVLEPVCETTRMNEQVPVLAAAGQGLILNELLLYDTTTLMSNRYPAFDLGSLIPPHDAAQKITTTAVGELIGPVMLFAKAPAAPGETVIKIPEYKFELPVKIIEASAVTGIQFTPQSKKSLEETTTELEIDLLVGNKALCVNPEVPIELTVGPVFKCSLKQTPAGFKSIMSKDPNGQAFEGSQNYRALRIYTKHEGNCVVTATIKDTGRTATASIMVVPEKRSKVEKHHH